MSDNAFPTPETEHMHYVPGLTKREYAAIHIAAALAGRGVTFAGENVAKRAVELADVVLKEAGK